MQQAVNTKVVQAAQQHGLISDSVVKVKRLGAPNADADRPRPFLIHCCTAADQHWAFKARSALKREREREIHYVHWASKAYEDESVFMSEAHLGWQ